ncbi:MAG: PEP-CTERM sorting domain-containing protein [Planctomycetota bacterium]|nr:PEP-CTERM sorting domain-containing protein [Planctomycetota bacterium]
MTPIDVTLEPGGELAVWSRNVEDPNRQKLLSFTGTLSSPVPTSAELSFDWRDATGAVHTSTPVSVAVSPNGTPVMIRHLVDFCPRRVSFHAEAGDVALQVRGEFKHECLIPEPGTGLLATAGLGALTLLRRKQLA